MYFFVAFFKYYLEFLGFDEGRTFWEVSVVVVRWSDLLLSLILSTETLMDSTTATAELGWTVYPVSGSSDNSVSHMPFLVICLTCNHKGLIKLLFKQSYNWMLFLGHFHWDKGVWLVTF